MIEGNLALPFTTTVLARSGSRAARRGPGDESPDGVAAQLQSAARWRGQLPAAAHGDRRHAQIGQIGMPRWAVYLDLSDRSPTVASCRWKSATSSAYWNRTGGYSSARPDSPALHLPDGARTGCSRREAKRYLKPKT